MDINCLKRYFNGTSSTEEAAEVESWLDSLEPGLAEKLAAAWETFRVQPDLSAGNTWDAAPLFQKIIAEIDADKQTSFPKAEPKRVHIPQENRQGYYGMAIAASVAVFMMAMFWLSSQPSFFGGSTLKTYDPSAWILKENPKGQKSIFQLQDGTKVKLNAASTLKIPEVFAADKREVILSGEAFFEVAHEVDRPFIVRSGNLHAKVLGTSFNARAYPDEDVKSFSLVEGKLLVYNIENNQLQHAVTLNPSEQASFNSRADSMLLTQFDLKEVLAWREQSIYFKKATIDVIIKELERWYGIDIRLADRNKYEEVRFTGSFQNKKLTQVLDGLHLAIGLEYSAKGPMIEIY